MQPVHAAAFPLVRRLKIPRLSQLTKLRVRLRRRYRNSSSSAASAHFISHSRIITTLLGKGEEIKDAPSHRVARFDYNSFLQLTSRMTPAVSYATNEYYIIQNTNVCICNVCHGNPVCLALLH
jgi:hypothetical protein